MDSFVDALNNAALQINSGKPVQLPRMKSAEADAIGQAIVQASKFTSEVHYKSYHDALINLANRPLFYEFLDNSLARACSEKVGRRPFWSVWTITVVMSKVLPAPPFEINDLC